MTKQPRSAGALTKEGVKTMKIKIRSFETGHFCTLGQLCKEAPQATVSANQSPMYAAEAIEETRAQLLKAEQISDIIIGLDLPVRHGSCVGNGIRINNDGTWSGWNTDPRESIEILRKNAAKNEALVAKWHATEYENS
jgi:hypothetical protein